MEMGCIGFLIGAVCSMCFIGIGVIYAENSDQRKSGADHHSYADIPGRNWDRRSDYGCYEQMGAEEVMFVLRNMQMSVRYSRTEKEALEYAINHIESEDEE